MPAAPGLAHERVRLDKWLWAARFYKTRSLSADEIAKGRVSVNGQLAKASREVHLADHITLRQGAVVRTVVVLGVSDQRGSAPMAQALFEETPQSLALRTQQALDRRVNADPAASIEQGRPTKRARRELADWNRWSASADEPP